MTRISDRLEIRFDTNEIISMNDSTTPMRTKVEPRIMHVLQILMKHSPEVVSREQLIAEVWDNYGGADDALNQSISHLRKLLSDTNKENRIIETVVKKGYRFTIETKGQKDLAPVLNTSLLSKWWMWAAILILIVVLILIFNMTSEAAIAPRVH